MTTMTTMTKRLLLSMIAAPLFLTASAFAAPSAEDSAAARALFEQAKTLVSENKWTEACAKLEQSKALDPRMLTVYRLADCHEHIGRTASAWMEFLEAAEMAKSAGETVKASDALDRAKKLEPKLSRLTITAEDDVPGLSITQDGSAVGKARLGLKTPIDPGEHVIVATAPKKKRFEKKLTVGTDSADLSVVIPKLEDEGGASLPTAEKSDEPVKKDGGSPPSGDHPASGSSQKTFALVAGGVGVVALGVGTWLAISAKSKNNDADAHCIGTRCDSEGKQLSDDARSRGNYATIAFGLGAAALIGGGVLWLTAPTTSKSSTSTGLVVAPAPLVGGGGLTMWGKF